MGALFHQLPDDLLAGLLPSYPGRELQARSLATLVYPRAAPCRNLVIHGTEATGKSAVTAALLDTLQQGPAADLRYAVVKSPECVTARHLFERTAGAVADALQWTSPVARCETLAALAVELSKMLKYVEHGEGWRFVLVFDAIDRQREAPPTLLPALARLSEMIPNLTVIFILTAPSPSLLRTASTPHVHFPPYTKAQFVTILTASSSAEKLQALPNTTAQETADLYARFVAAVHDALVKPTSRTLPSLQQACRSLWPRFTAPVAAGTHKAREFSKLLIAARAYLQDESVLAPSLVSSRAAAAPAAGAPAAAAAATVPKSPSAKLAAVGAGPGAGKQDTAGTELSSLLPPTAKLLLIAAYLASHNAPRHDLTLFSTWHHGRRRRGGGVSLHRGPRSKHRKIARKLLGPGVFVLERMVAIYAAVHREWAASEKPGAGVHSSTVDGDVGMAIATLASLRLLLRVGGNGGSSDLDRGSRWRVGVGWEVVRGVGRSLGVEVEEWLVE